MRRSPEGTKGSRAGRRKRAADWLRPVAEVESTGCSYRYLIFENGGLDWLLCCGKESLGHDATGQLLNADLRSTQRAAPDRQLPLTQLDCGPVSRHWSR